MHLKSFCGRKRDSFIWWYFVHDAPADRSKCQGIGRDGKQSKRKLVGTNLRAAHKNASVEFSSNNDEIKSSKVDTAIASRTSGLSGTATPSITNFMKAPKTWPRDRNEAAVRDRALCNTVVMTGALLQMV
jgi:hypothetical protein